METIQSMHANTEGFVRHLYSSERDAFDMDPMLIAYARRGDNWGVDHCILLTHGSPLDAAAFGVEQLKERNDEVGIVVFVSASWKKNLEGERVGEMVIIIAETKTEMFSGGIDVTRNADGTIALGKLEIAQHAHSRVPLLYKPTEH